MYVWYMGVEGLCDTMGVVCPIFRAILVSGLILESKRK